MTTNTQKTLIPFVNRQQLSLFASLEKGEEGEYFTGLLERLAARVESMPATYETEEDENPVAFLHYFAPWGDAWIIEKDIDSDGQGQIQALGLVKIHEKELGYVSIQEWIANGAEIDLHFNPQLVSILRHGKELAPCN